MFHKVPTVTTVITLTHCKFITLSKLNFEKAMSLFPNIEREFMEAGSNVDWEETALAQIRMKVVASERREKEVKKPLKFSLYSLIKDAGSSSSSTSTSKSSESSDDAQQHIHLEDYYSDTIQGE